MDTSMTGRLAQFPLDGGGTVLVQVGDADNGPVTRGWGSGDGLGSPVQMQETFEQVVGRVGPAASALLETMSGMARAPDDISIEFGVQLSARAGAFIAAFASSANFKVTVCWHKSP